MEAFVVGIAGSGFQTCEDGGREVLSGGSRAVEVVFVSLRVLRRFVVT